MPKMASAANTQSTTPRSKSDYAKGCSAAQRLTMANGTTCAMSVEHVVRNTGILSKIVQNMVGTQMQ
jgi:hypothetical protein